MEERITKLEQQVNALLSIVVAQQEFIVSYDKTIDGLMKQQERNIEIQQSLFTYCKKLRRELEKVKA